VLWKYISTNKEHCLLVSITRIVGLQQLELTSGMLESWKAITGCCSYSRCSQGSWDQHIQLLIFYWILEWYSSFDNALSSNPPFCGDDHSIGGFTSWCFRHLLQMSSEGQKQFSCFHNVYTSVPVDVHSLSAKESQTNSRQSRTFEAQTSFQYLGSNLGTSADVSAIISSHL